MIQLDMQSKREIQGRCGRNQAGCKTFKGSSGKEGKLMFKMLISAGHGAGATLEGRRAL